VETDFYLENGNDEDASGSKNFLAQASFRKEYINESDFV